MKPEDFTFSTQTERSSHLAMMKSMLMRSVSARIVKGEDSTLRLSTWYQFNKKSGFFEKGIVDVICRSRSAMLDMKESLRDLDIEEKRDLAEAIITAHGARVSGILMEAEHRRYKGLGFHL